MFDSGGGSADQELGSIDGSGHGSGELIDGDLVGFIGQSFAH